MNKKGDVPGWMYALGIVLGIITLIVVLLIIAKGGHFGVGQLRDVFG